MYNLFKVMHKDIKKLCDENQNLKKEIVEMKSIISNNPNSGGRSKRKILLDYDSSWLMVYVNNFLYSVYN